MTSPSATQERYPLNSWWRTRPDMHSERYRLFTSTVNLHCRQAFPTPCPIHTQKLKPSARTSVGVVHPKLNTFVVKFTLL